MPYKDPYILREKAGNNAFAYDIREDKTLMIPSLIEWTLDDVKIGDEIVFEEIDDWVLKSCTWLQHFVRLTNHPTIPLSDYPTIPPITIFDNHNHALYFWLEAVRNGILKPWFDLFHIDEHSDLWDNENILDLDKAIHDEKYAWEFTNFSCNVGNYIRPALRCGLLGQIIRIENEHEIDAHIGCTPSENSVLNLDLDIFAPEMDFIDEKKKIQCIRNLMKQVKCVTIATSPYFIDQWIAIKKLSELLHSEMKFQKNM